MRISHRVVGALLGGTAALALWVAIGSNVVGKAERQDFLSFYTGAVMAGTGQMGNLYNYEIQCAVQDKVVPNLSYHFPWVRPPFYAMMLAPLSWMPVHVAFPVWMALQIGLMGVVCVWAWRRFGPESLPFCILFVPTSLGIANGQDCVFLLLEMLGTWLLLERKRDFAAGLVLSLTLFKYHLLVLVPLAILWKRRWRLLGGYATGGAALAAWSLALVGIQGIRSYANMLVRPDMGPTSPYMFVGFDAIGLNLGIGSAAARGALMLIPLGMVLWTLWKSPAGNGWFWPTVAGSLLFCPHTYVYDVASLIVPELMVLFSPAPTRIRLAAIVAILPVAYFFNSGGIPWSLAPSLAVTGFFAALCAMLPAVSPQPAPVPTQEPSVP